MARPPAQWSVFFDVLVVDRQISDFMRVALDGCGLTPLEYGLYSVLADEPGITATGVAERMAAPLTTVADWLAGPVRRGHVQRMRYATDGRAWALTLTEEGDRIFDRACAAFTAAYERYLRHPNVDPDVQHAVLAEMARSVAAVTAELRAERDGGAASAS